jgi:methylenetetrahydrofolate--tRNA-(uracil-5-)-methyltransferase
LNCPFSKEEYTLFYDALCHAQTVALHDFEKVYEGCMPIEILAKRGFNAPLFGPLKPVGLYPTMDKPKPFAVLQLRQESFNDDCYNLVGFQTNLTFGEQRRIIHLIPGLKDVEIVRYGVMHRNTYLDAPQVQQNLQSTKYPLLFFAGQLIGVEGYLESASCGLLAASYLHQYLTTNEIIPLSPQTMMGALGRYLNLANQNFTPMGANYGILCSLVSEVEKTKKRLLYYNYSMSETNTYLHWINGLPSRI